MFIASTVSVNSAQLFANETKHIHDIWAPSWAVRNINLNPFKSLKDSSGGF